ncbi:uncharacterized protein LOC127239393 [Andrographis paniculata]|uniref:uncharacterized protein LOC127239393 n=1 Tax=Andrographis paniculata TaxID=175694 RepID=UPI0021E7AE41|nr:uncharacterized protein LOC127239393 [Andrographis paniculata]
MTMVYRWKSVSNCSSVSSRLKYILNRTFCSSNTNSSKKPSVVNSGSSSSSNAPSPAPSLSNYGEQYKALEKLDFTTAAKILFSDPPKKKKFGLDFHLVQLFFVCLPSLAVYLVAQYARSEMRRMDAELEKKKQAEFEAQAKEMELKAAKEKEKMESNPQLLEVKERLNKLEERVKEIVEVAKKQPSKSVTDGQEVGENRSATQVEPDNSQNESSMKTTKERGAEPATHPSQTNQKDNNI